MNPVALYARYSLLGFVRLVKRKAVQEPLLATGCVAAAFLFAAFAAEMLVWWGSSFSDIAPYVIMGYSLYKIVQDAPALSVRASLIASGIFSLKQIKAVFLVRSVVPTLVFVGACASMGLGADYSLIAACLGNIAANVVSLTKHSVTRRSLSACLVALSIAGVVFAVLAHSLVVGIVLLGASAAAFASLPYFVYDDWYPYCQNQQLLHDALIEGDRESISLSQQAFFSKSTKGFCRVGKSGYGAFLYERIALSRLCDHGKGLFACVAVSAGANFIPMAFPVCGEVERAALLGVVVISVEAFLSMLNGIERDTVSMNSLFGRSFVQALRRGWLVQAFVVILVMICSASLFAAVPFVLSAAFCLLLPVQNMYAAEAHSTVQKVVGYAFKAAVIGLPFLGLFLPAAL